MAEPPENEELARRLRAQQQSTRQMFTDATQRLVSILQPQASVPGQMDAALEAVLAVGRMLGVEIRAPHHPEVPRVDPGGAPDRFEAIARASHLRVRPVQLRAGWWQED